MIWYLWYVQCAFCLVNSMNTMHVNNQHNNKMYAIKNMYVRNLPNIYITTSSINASKSDGKCWRQADARHIANYFIYPMFAIPSKIYIQIHVHSQCIQNILLNTQTQTSPAGIINIYRQKYT